MVTREFRKRLKSKLNDYRELAQKETFDACRLVMYCSGECSPGIDVPLEEVEKQIEGGLAEGYCVDFAVNDRVVYLRIYEDDEPDWEYVFEERSIPTFAWPSFVAVLANADLYDGRLIGLDGVLVVESTAVHLFFSKDHADYGLHANSLLVSFDPRLTNKGIDPSALHRKWVMAIGEFVSPIDKNFDCDVPCSGMLKNVCNIRQHDQRFES